MPTPITNVTRAAFLSALFFCAVPLSSHAAGFPDVPENMPELQAILYMQSSNVISGYPDGTFRPYASINRAEFLKIVLNQRYGMTHPCTFGGDAPSAPRDIQTSAWYAPYLCMAMQHGIVGGYPDGTFRPEKSITLPEAAKILFTLNHQEDTQALEVAASAALWYEPYVRFLSQVHAIPQSIPDLAQPLTRAQVADILYRFAFNGGDLPHWTYDNLRDGRFVESAMTSSKGKSSRSPSSASSVASGISKKCLDYVKKPQVTPDMYAVTPFADAIAEEQYQSALEACESRLRAGLSLPSTSSSSKRQSSSAAGPWTSYTSDDEHFGISYPPGWRVKEYTEPEFMIGLAPKIMETHLCTVTVDTEKTTLKDIQEREADRFADNNVQKSEDFSLNIPAKATRVTTTSVSHPELQSVVIFIVFEGRNYVIHCEEEYIDAEDLDAIYQSFRLY